MSADIFVYLDTVQFSKNGLQNRNQIKAGSQALWLTLPVKHRLGQSIRETEIADKRAKHKHWKTVNSFYSKSSGFKEFEAELDTLFHADAGSLSETAIASTEWMLEKLNVKTRRIRASELSGVEGRASELVASICRQLGARTYLTGTGALEYLNVEDFRPIGCDIQVQTWSKLEYRQQRDEEGFVADLSTLDLLLNCPGEAADLILAAGGWKPLQ